MTINVPALIIILLVLAYCATVAVGDKRRARDTYALAMQDIILRHIRYVKDDHRRAMYEWIQSYTDKNIARWMREGASPEDAVDECVNAYAISLGGGANGDSVL